MLQQLYDDPRYYDERGMGSDAADRWAERAREVLRLIGEPPQRILDYGAGDGGLVCALRALEIGADGVEISQAGRELARTRDVILHAEIPAGWDRRFSAVTMLHVLEHVHDPIATLSRVRRVLTPGGQLLVEVPNVASLDALWPPHRRLILDLPFHVHHFTPRTLHEVVARAGFQPTAIRRFNPIALEWALSQRDRHRRPASLPNSGATADAGNHRTAPAAATSLWHRMLPLVRAVAPGSKLQLLATA